MLEMQVPGGKFCPKHNERSRKNLWHTSASSFFILLILFPCYSCFYYYYFLFLFSYLQSEPLQIHWRIKGAKNRHLRIVGLSAPPRSKQTSVDLCRWPRRARLPSATGSHLRPVGGWPLPDTVGLSLHESSEAGVQRVGVVTPQTG